MKERKLLLAIMSLLGLCACNINLSESNSISFQESSGSNLESETSFSSSSDSSDISSPVTSSSPSYDETQDIIINLSENTTVDNNNGYVVIEDQTIWILGSGTYTLSGTINGQVIVSAGEEAVEIVLSNANISSDISCPFLIYEADKCEISAKKDTENFINDLRVESTDDYNAAIYALCDLTLKGKGTLNVSNIFNNGIHTKDDLDIKNLTLNVRAVNNAIKGNDSLTIESGVLNVISTQGDCLKTDNSNISSKGNQRGTITINGGTLNLYAACDCIDASYDVVINNNPIINCYTESYSIYSEEISITTSTTLYLKVSQSISNYRYAVLFTLEDDTTIFENTKTINSGSSGRRDVYFSLDVPKTATGLQVYAYESTNSTNSTTSYLYKSEQVSINETFDCLSVRLSGNSLNLSWTNYQTQGPGGMQEGNMDKADYSCKGIKADNEITINGGNIDIKSHDDAIHTNGDVTLENGNVGLGNVSINGGILTLYSDDDGIHADNVLTIAGGFVNITNSYEGIEGNIININGGETRIVSKDDGVNATYFSETPLISINDGILYLNANGDGIDSNGNIEMTGGYVLALGPSSSGNGVLDYDISFKATGGYLLAIGASGMNQSVSASNDAKSGTKTISTSIGSYVTLIVDNETMLIIKVLKSNVNYCTYSYVGNEGSVSVSSSISESLVDDLYYANVK